MEIKKVFKKPYVFWLLGIFILYFALNIYLSKFYITLQYIPYYLKTLNWFVLLLSFIFSVSIAFLVALNMVFGYIVYKDKEKKKTNTPVTALGALGGLSTGICSACVGSVFPSVFGLFGITLSWAALPFRGAEVQAVLILLLGANLYYLKNSSSSHRSEGILNKNEKPREVKNSP